MNPPNHNNKCTVVVLAAGKGTRMKSALPKPLHEVAGRPMLAQVLTVARELDPIAAWPTWVLSNHDEPRHLTRFGWAETGWRHPSLGEPGAPDLALGADCVAHARMFFNSPDLNLATAAPGADKLPIYVPPAKTP